MQQTGNGREVKSFQSLKCEVFDDLCVEGVALGLTKMGNCLIIHKIKKIHLLIATNTIRVACTTPYTRVSIRTHLFMTTAADTSFLNCLLLPTLCSSFSVSVSVAAVAICCYYYHLLLFCDNACRLPCAILILPFLPIVVLHSTDNFSSSKSLSLLCSSTLCANNNDSATVNAN